ncbi:hypothetical protein ACIBU0_42230 [Streptomyces sp. NPDC049627]|uniref:hypothetical protein n=1 Tax=Streptomyces sp. NPDC049627 TaxID=3365595 RepID=UPI0037AE4E4C
MATKTGINTVPTRPQADLLIVALGAPNHRIPSTATGRTLDIMLRRQWIREYTSDGRLASTVRDYPGFTHFRLTHHGVNAAKKARAARTAAAERGPRTLDVEGIGWTCVEAGRKWATEYEGVKFELERRTANVLDGCPDTGWYLYGGSHFGEYMGARFKAAAVEAFPYVCPKNGHPQPADEVEAEAAGRVDWWAVKDREGNLITQVEATSYNHAVQVADQDPKVRAARPGSGGLVFMRLESIEKPAPAAAQPRKTIPAAAPARRTATVRTEYIGRSIPSRLEAAGAPGGMQYSKRAGALRWVLPDGEELTPGQAEERFLG